MLPSRPTLHGFLPGTAALTAPARPVFAGRRQRSCRGRSAAKRPLSSGPAPGRSRRPLLKDGQAARRTKAARGHGPPGAANLVSRYSGVARRRPISGRAEPGATVVLRGLPRRARRAGPCGRAAPESVGARGHSPAESLLQWVLGGSKEGCNASALR
ncbi:hypothetical protein HispidOSU_029138 [Sigmodon hispidus]